MSRTIIVCMNDKDRAQQLMTVACGIAARNDGHVIGLFVLPGMQVPIGASMHFTPEIYSAQTEYFKKISSEMKGVFEERMRKEGTAHEWRAVEGREPRIADVFMEHARQTDLVIIGQIDPDKNQNVEADFAERLVTECGRPVLVVPHTGSFEKIGSQVVIGWNATREAARAAFDALPLIKDAKEVRVVWVDPQTERELSGNLPGAECATALARHGINAVSSPTPTSGIGAGQALLNQVSDTGADLLVMGAYGHSRLREFVFSGASRVILEQMTVPVLMSH